MKHLKLFEAYFENDSMDITHKELTSLSELPEGLKYLYCNNNKLTFLPELPEGLDSLECFMNDLTFLPELPKTITNIYCYDNQITTLPKLPESLEILSCFDNKIKYLPELPKSLDYLICYNNPLECIIPFKFIPSNMTIWKDVYYLPYIKSYDGQKNILTRQPHMVNELVKQAEIHPKIKEEFAHLFTGSELNLLN